MSDTEIWVWECIGDHSSATFMGDWQAQAYISERPDGWYAAGEGHKTGPEYLYRLPGRTAPSGPHSRERAAGLARQMIGLAADASIPGADQVILYQPPGGQGRQDNEARYVTGERWWFASAGLEHVCGICARTITSGWSDAPWKNARRFVCNEHVVICLDDRPGRSMHGPSRGAPKAARGGAGQ